MGVAGVSAVLGLLVLAIHCLLVVAAAPVLAGSVVHLRARFAGRVGPSPLQPWRELRKLARKQPVLPESASPLFAVAPVLVLAATGLAALLVPSFTLGMLTGPDADLLVIAGLLMGARAVLALAALDAGTALGGMGASRETGLAVLAEPALFLAFLVLAGLTGSTNLDLIAASLRDSAAPLRAALALALPALALVVLALNAPAGEEEPAMLRAATRLDYSGRHLAALELAGALRLIVWLGLLAALICPFGLANVEAGPLAWVLGLVVWAVKLVVLAAGLALLEALAGRVEPARRRGLLGFAVVLGVAAATFLFAATGSV